MTAAPDPPDPFEQLLLDALAATPAGQSEYLLIQRLRAAGLFPQADLHDPLGLFRVHFELFHRLYRLRLRLWESRSGHLEIGALCIRIAPYRPGEPGLVAADPLAGYYLEPHHLTATTADEVRSLLDRFHRALTAHDRRAEALRELGLDDPVELAAAKRHYRRLAMAHHPDRGGDPERLKRLNAAMAILEQCL